MRNEKTKEEKSEQEEDIIISSDESHEKDLLYPLRIFKEQFEKMINMANTEKDFTFIFNYLNDYIPKTSLDIPYFIFIPPTLKHMNQWYELLNGLSLPGDSLTHLIDAGFMPIDMGSTLTDNIRINTLYKIYIQEDPAHTHLCLDPYYGVILFKKNDIIRNLGVSFIYSTQRYIKKVNPNYVPDEEGLLYSKN